MNSWSFEWPNYLYWVIFQLEQIVEADENEAAYDEQEGDQDVVDLLRGDSALLDAAKKGNLSRVHKLLTQVNLWSALKVVLIFLPGKHKLPRQRRQELHSSSPCSWL